MRVLTVGNRFPPAGTGGYERVWEAAVAGLRAAGHDAVVLTPPELGWYWRDHAFPRKRLDEVLRLERRNRRVLDGHLAGADLVVWFAMGGMSLSLLARPRVPQLAVVHDGWPLYGPGVDQGTRRGWPKDRVTWWSCNSAFTRDAIVARAGIERARTSVESPGIDPAAFPASEPPPWRGELLVLGRVEEAKGVADAIAGLPDGMRLTVAGPGEREHRTALEGSADARVRFTGPTADPAAAIAAADAVLFPVRWDEPWGLVPLEAMAVGRPVVATGTGGSAEYLRHEENALLVPKEDPAALRAAAERLRDQPELRARLVAGGRATAARYDQAAWTADLVALAERIATSG